MPYGPKRLGAAEADAIRRLYASRGHTQQQLAGRFGVSQSLVSKIVRGLAHQRSPTFGGSAVVRRGYHHGHS